MHRCSLSPSLITLISNFKSGRDVALCAGVPVVDCVALVKLADMSTFTKSLGADDGAFKEKLAGRLTYKMGAPLARAHFDQPGLAFRSSVAGFVRAKIRKITFEESGSALACAILPSAARS